MKTSIKWQASSPELIASGKYIGILEFQDNAGQWHSFEVMALTDRLVFGGCCNAGFLESGYILRADCIGDETELLRELLADLECFYNDGPQAVSAIVHNDRM